MIEESRLDPTFLERALDRLQQSLKDYDAEPESGSLRDALRDSVVMRFVFTYQLLVQVLSRYVQLQHLRFTPESEMTLSKIVRRSNDLGILRAEWEIFAAYRDARNGAAHAYSESKAVRAVEYARSFADEAEYVLRRVKEKLDE